MSADDTSPSAHSTPPGSPAEDDHTHSGTASETTPGTAAATAGGGEPINYFMQVEYDVARLPWGILDFQWLYIRNMIAVDFEIDGPTDQFERVWNTHKWSLRRCST